MKKCSIAGSICAAAALCAVLAGCQSQTTVFFGCEVPSTTEVMRLDQGEMIEDFTGLDYARELNRDNGSYVTLSVENLGDDPVVLSINGQGDWNVFPGDQGSLAAEVTKKQWGGDRAYRFKVAPRNGGSIHIRYEIVQGDAR